MSPHRLSLDGLVVVIAVLGAPEPEGGTLEVVRPLPPEDPSAYR